jgi:hypothetical protein
MNVLQVNQSKTSPIDCHVYDLFQPGSGRRPTRQVGSSVNKIASSPASNLDRSNALNVPCYANKYTETNEPIKFQQDSQALDCLSINGLPTVFTSATMARDCLLSAVQRGQHTQKNVHSHLVITLQPILMSTHSGRILQHGEYMSILEMASFDSKHRTTRVRDPVRADAHTAVMHCLKAIRHNQLSKNGVHRKVPYLQHRATMLLQPLFVEQQTCLSVTLVVTASPSNRDYADKKMLLSEIVQLYSPAPALNAATGVARASRDTKLHWTLDETDSKSHCYNQSTEVPSFCTNRSFLKSNEHDHFETSSLMTYSDSLDGSVQDDLSPLPPPIVPGFKERNDELVQPSCAPATAPLENHIVLQLPMVTNESLSSATSDRNSALEALMKEAKFSYIKTINKVVHASKKKSRNIMERISVTTFNNDQHHVQQRMSDLEKQNILLLQEIGELRACNQQLEKLLLDKKYYQTTDKDIATKPHCNINSITASNESIFSSECLRASNSFDSGDRKRSESSTVSAYLNDDIRDNPIFQHMKQLTREYSDDLKPLGGDDSQSYDAKLSSDTVESEMNNENDIEIVKNSAGIGSKVLFDDPLLQHMAVLSSYN